MTIGGAYRGGGDKTIPNSVQHPNVPQHGIDVACAQEAYRKFKAQMAAVHCAEGRNAQTKNARFVRQLFWMSQSMCRWLASSEWATLSEKQRAWVHIACGPEFVARVTAHVLAQPRVAPMVLPLKPPGGRA